jgi:predicted peptidase
MRIRFLALPLLLAFISCGSKPQESPQSFSRETFLSREISIGGLTSRYRVYVPKDGTNAGGLPVMLYLHGSDERGTDNEGQLSGPAPSILGTPNRFNFIIVFPQCPVGRYWDKEMIPIAMAELEQTVNEFNGDPSRLYLAGFSLGGYGVWTTAALYPTKFAAIVPMSGRLLPRPTERRNFPPEILELADAADPFAAFASRLKDMPTWIYHGSNDNIVPVSNSRSMTKALKDTGNADVHYTELQNTGHVSLNAAFADQQLFDWLAHQTRK